MEDPSPDCRWTRKFGEKVVEEQPCAPLEAFKGVGEEEHLSFLAFVDSGRTLMKGFFHMEGERYFVDPSFEHLDTLKTLGQGHLAQPMVVYKEGRGGDQNMGTRGEDDGFFSKLKAQMKREVELVTPAVAPIVYPSLPFGSGQCTMRKTITVRYHLDHSFVNRFNSDRAAFGRPFPEGGSNDWQTWSDITSYVRVYGLAISKFIYERAVGITMVIDKVEIHDTPGDTDWNKRGVSWVDSKGNKRYNCTLNINSLLTAYTNWAAKGNAPSGTTGTLNHLLTDCQRLFSGESGVVGVAWLGVVCSNTYNTGTCTFLSGTSGYQCSAHELGHNFNSGHDFRTGNQDIMSYSSRKYDGFSDQSYNSICSFLATKGYKCLKDTTSTCTPQCTGKVCGSDGCGSLCGQCKTGQTCTSQGVCQTSCTPNCLGKVCGSDGCSGSCGTCSSGASCSNGLCTSPCTPNCSNKGCGMSDGCSGFCGTGCDLASRDKGYICDATTGWKCSLPVTTQPPTQTTKPPTQPPTQTTKPPTQTPTQTTKPPTQTPTQTTKPPTQTPTQTTKPPTQTPTQTTKPPTQTPTQTTKPPTQTPTQTTKPPTQTPTQPPCTRKCDGKTCGSDGCGGSCGVCGQGTTCNTITSTCSCVPSTSCIAQARTCGQIYDGCKYVTCGPNCTSPPCIPNSNACLNKDCGVVSDGCKQIECGKCTSSGNSSVTCLNNKCTITSVCGSCSTYAQCTNNGQSCVCRPGYTGNGFTCIPASVPDPTNPSSWVADYGSRSDWSLSADGKLLSNTNPSYSSRNPSLIRWKGSQALTSVTDVTISARIRLLSSSSIAGIAVGLDSQRNYGMIGIGSGRVLAHRGSPSGSGDWFVLESRMTSLGINRWLNVTLVFSKLDKNTSAVKIFIEGQVIPSYCGDGCRGYHAPSLLTTNYDTPFFKVADIGFYNLNGPSEFSTLRLSTQNSVTIALANCAQSNNDLKNLVSNLMGVDESLFSINNPCKKRSAEEGEVMVSIFVNQAGPLESAALGPSTMAAELEIGGIVASAAEVLPITSVSTGVSVGVEGSIVAEVVAIEEATILGSSSAAGSSGLSAAAIAGIAVGSLVGAALLGAAGYVAVKKMSENRTNSEETPKESDKGLQEDDTTRTTTITSSVPYIPKGGIDVMNNPIKNKRFSITARGVGIEEESN